MNAKNFRQLTLMLTIALTIVACESGHEPQHSNSQGEFANFTIETRGMNPGNTFSINLNVTGKINDTKTYELTTAEDGSVATFEPIGEADKTYIVPGTNLLPVYAWGEVTYNDVRMPVFYTNPTASATWNNGFPTIAMKLSPATARVKLEVKNNAGTTIIPSAATLYGISTPNYTWDATTMPPALEAASNTVNLLVKNDYKTGGYVQVIPGVIATNAHLLNITANSKKYTVIANRPYTFLAGSEYMLTVTINQQGEAEVTHFNISDFEEGGAITVGR
ncbi:fimbrillin family protein [Bacteroides sp. 224]|uniref:fimbrillin family protein n=1 Tax=Bacteroides sp. 224 TaxID=2302936 RepID=UPI0013D3A4C9|nr:fimbrillin family protein [Bacteroides sp. 224]